MSTRDAAKSGAATGRCLLTLFCGTGLMVMGSGPAAQSEETARGGAAELPLIRVHINPEARVKAERGAQTATLKPGVWRSFLVRFDNEAKVTAVPRLQSPNAPAEAGARDRWIDVLLEPANRPLSGRGVEYRTLKLRSRDTGMREAAFSFDVGQGTQDLGFRGQVSILFHCTPEESNRGAQQQ